MHRHEAREDSSVRQLSHFNALFTGWGTRIYDVTMVRLTRRLYRRVVADVALILSEGKVLDAGTGPGTLARELARRQPRLQIYGIDLSEDMIRLALAHTQREQLEERVHFATSDVAHLPYPVNSFDVIISTISMHHWYELEQPLRDLYRVLRPGGHLWIYDFRFLKVQAVEKALASTPFAGTRLEHTLVRTGFLPFALYRRFALQKMDSEDHPMNVDDQSR
ncbi:MAG TPA: class I SAM-dependent methyltransferase [Ktedonobacteraceae bacterium]